MQYSSIDQGGSMGLLDKLLGRGTKPAADLQAESSAQNATAGDEQLAQREDETSPHHHAEQEAGS
jgi:hypothetical protein